MSMSELEARCMNNLHTLRSELPDSRMVIPDISIVKAVLAEAGVAELVEALRDVQARITEAIDLERISAAQALEEMAPIVSAALTGAQ